MRFKNIIKNKRIINTTNIAKTLSCVALAYTISISPVNAQQIIPDGQTNTTLNIQNNLTNVYTTTIKGTNAFNSFSKFNIDTGNKINLHVPNNSDTLINLIFDESTYINGHLNAIKNNHIGGNIFLVNPHGITVGTQGVINVGSLTAITPTTDFMNTLFNAPGMLNDQSVIQILNKTTPINSTAQINIEGKINAIEKVHLDSGSFYNAGEIYTGAYFEENNISIGDVVNINTLENGTEFAHNSGEIIIKAAQDFINAGNIVADGSNNIDAGKINITALNNITLKENSLISAKGVGENSSGGNIYIYGNNDSYFNNNAIIDARGGNISGDGGFIELSATNEVVVNGQFKANPINGNVGTILIDPVTLTINTDQILPGTDINWTADETITIDGAVISTRNIGGSTDYASAASTGNSGSVTMTAPHIYVQNLSEIYSHADGGFTGGDVTLNGNASAVASATDANGIVNINNSTIKANNISFTAAGGTATGAAFADAFTYAENGSTLTADGNISFTATGGEVTPGTGDCDADAKAKAYVDNSTLTSGGAITFTAAGGTGHTGYRILTHAEGHAFARNSSSLTSVDNIEFTSSGGFADTINTERGKLYLRAYSYADTGSTLTTTGTGNIIFTSTGGTGTATVAYGSSFAPAYSYAQWSVLDSAGDIIITATGGTASAADGGANANAEAYSRGAILTSGGEINHTATAGNISNGNAYSSEAYAIAKAYDNSTLTSGGDVNLTATAGTIPTWCGGDVHLESYAISDDSTINSGGGIYLTSTSGSGNMGYTHFNYGRTYAKDSTLTSNDDMIFISTGGSGSPGRGFEGQVWVYSETSTLNSGGDITFTGTGGSSSANYDFRGDAYVYTNLSTLNVDGNLTFTSTGGNGSTNRTFYSPTQAGSYNSTVNVDKNITFTATSGNGTSGYSAWNATSKTFATDFSNITAGGYIKFDSTATQAGQTAEAYVNNSASLTTTSSTQTLLINADNTLDPTSTLTATINVGLNKIDVDDITPIDNNIELKTTHTAAGPTSIYGDGTINLYSGASQIDITNNSSLNLYVHDIENTTESQLIKTGTDTSTFTVNNTNDTTSRPINITGNSTSNVILAGEIKASEKPDNGCDIVVSNTGSYIMVDHSDIKSYGGDILLSTPQNILLNVAMLSARDIDRGTDDHLNDTSLGNSGKITLTSNRIDIQGGSSIYNFADDVFTGDYVEYDTTTFNYLINSQTKTSSYLAITADVFNIFASGSDLIAEEDIIFSKQSPTDLIISDASSDYLNDGELAIANAAGTIIIGNDIKTNYNVNNINIDDVINITSSITIVPGAAGSTRIHAGEEIHTTGDITLKGAYIYAETGSVLEGDNVNIEPTNYLSIDDLDITTTSLLKILSGDVANNNIFYKPGTITAQNVHANNFFQQGQPLTLEVDVYDRDLHFGNIGNTTINGSKFIPSSITLQSGTRSGDTIYLYGDIETSGDLNLTTYNFIVDPAATVTADTTVFRQNDEVAITVGDATNFSPAKLADFDSGLSFIDGVNVQAGSVINIAKANATLSFTGGTINLDEATLTAPNIVINPTDGGTDYYLDINGTTINATDSLTLNKGDLTNLGIYFVPDSITVDTATVTSDFISQGGPLSLETNEYNVSIYFGNTSNISIDSAAFVPSSITLQSGTYSNAQINLYGDINTSGNFNITSNNLIVSPTANITADNTIFNNTSGTRLPVGTAQNYSTAELERFSSSLTFDKGIIIYDGTINITKPGATLSISKGDIDIDTATLTAPNIVIDPNDGGTSYYLDINGTTINATNSLTINKGDVENRGIRFVPDSITVDTATVTSDFISQGGALSLETNEYNVSIYFGNTSNISIDSAAFVPSSITLQSGTYSNAQINLYGDIATSGDFNITSNNLIVSPTANITADNTIFNNTSGTRLTVGTAQNYSTAELERFSSSLTFDKGIIVYDGTINITKPGATLSISKGDIDLNTATLTAPHVVIDPTDGGTSYYLDINGTTINATDSLTINKGDVTNRGIYFNPNSITVDTDVVTSDFITQGGPLTLEVAGGDPDIYLGNTANISIDSATYIPSGITLLSGTNSSDLIHLYGDINTSGDFNITTNSFIVELDANITADNTIFNNIAGTRLTIGTGQVYSTGELARFSSSLTFNKGIIVNDGTINITKPGATLSFTKGDIDLNTATLTAPNVVIDPTDGGTNYYLDINSTTINATDSLTINKGDVANTGIVFIPNAITVDTDVVTSDFITQGGALTLEAVGGDPDINLGNTANISINSATYVPSSITLLSGTNSGDYIHLYGNIVTSGDFNITTNVHYIDLAANITANNTTFNNIAGTRLTIGPGQGITPDELARFTSGLTFDKGIIVTDGTIINITKPGATLSFTKGDIDLRTATLTAPNVVIDPTDGGTNYYLSVNNTTINASNSLTINKGDVANTGIYFVPDAITVDTATVTSDFIVQGGALTLEAVGGDPDIYFGNTSNISIDGNQFIPSSITLQSGTNSSDLIHLYGDIETSDDFFITANDFVVELDANITAYTTIINNLSNSRITIGNGQRFSPDELNRFSSSLTFNDGIYIDNGSIITITKPNAALSFTGGPININTATLTAPNIIIDPSISINEFSINGTTINASNTLTINARSNDSKALIFNPASITLDTTNLNSDFMSQGGALILESGSNSVKLGNLSDISLAGNPLVPSSIYLRSADNASYNVNLLGNIETSGDMTIISRNIIIDPAASITANNSNFNSYTSSVEIGDGKNLTSDELDNINGNLTFGSIGGYNTIAVEIWNNLTTTNDITTKSEYLSIYNNATLDANNIYFIADNYIIDTGAGTSITATNDVVFSSETRNLFIVSDVGYLTPAQIEKVHCNIFIGNNSDTNSLIDNLYIDDTINHTSPLMFEANNDITINAGGSITSTASDTAIVMNTQDFINDSGADALNTPNGRWLVYSNNPTDTVEGGLTYNKKYNATYAGNPPASISMPDNYMLYSIAPTLTFTADNKNRDYGDANPALTYSVTGLIDGDTEADATSGSVDISTNALQTSNVGVYTIDIEQGTVALTDLGYQINTFTDGTLTIDKALLTARPNDVTREYGENTPDYSVNYTGFKNGETIDTIAGYAGAPMLFAPADTSFWPVGRYEEEINILGTTETSTNYTFTIQAGFPGDITITPATLDVTADNQTRIYGDANPALTYTITGYKNGQTYATSDLSGTPDITTTSIATDNAGIYAGVINPANGTLNSSNYIFNFVDGNMTINKATLTEKPTDMMWREYGHASYYISDYTGFKNGENIHTIAGYSGGPTYSAPGDLITNVPGLYFDSVTISNTTESSTNYNFVINNANPGDITVTEALLYVDANNTNKTYGSINPAFTASYDGFVLGQGPSDLGGSLTFNTLADTNSNVGNYTVTPSGYISSNYSFIYRDGNLTIDPANLTVTANDATRLYGSANPQFDATFTGLVAGDQPSDYNPAFNTIATINSDVGNYAIAVSGVNDPNYNINYIEGTLNIDKTDLFVTVDAKTKTYGDPNPTLTANFNGFVLGQDESVLGGSLTTNANIYSSVGDYPITGLTLTSSNYTIITDFAMLTVNPADLLISADNKIKTYGSANPALTATFTGLKALDQPNDYNPTLNTLADANTGVGGYDINVSGVVDPNYNITFAKGTLTINPADLTVTANDAARLYGAANPQFNATFNGLVAGDQPSDYNPTLNTLADANTGVGGYDINVSGVVDPNYNINYVKGTLTINPADLTVTANDAARLYGAVDPQFDATFNGLVAGDQPGDYNPAFNTVAVVNSNVGNYDLNVSGVNDPNYNISYVSGTLTINPADLLITADDKTKTYGTVNPALTATFTGLTGGDQPGDYNPTLVTLADTNTGVGGYDINVSGVNDPNYNINYAKGTLTINPADLTVTANNAARLYGAANPQFDATFNGLVAGDQPGDYNPTLVTLAETTSNVGGYDINVSGVNDPNYNINYAKGTLTINPADLTITANDKTRTYGAANPTFTGTFTGLVAGDQPSDYNPSYTSASVNADAGTYDITVSGVNDPNYNINYAKGTLTINPAELTITADDASKLEGEPNPELTATYDGFVLGDDASKLSGDLQLYTTATETSTAGNYPITPSGQTSNNYTIAYVDGTLAVLTNPNINTGSSPIEQMVEVIITTVVTNTEGNTGNGNGNGNGGNGNGNGRGNGNHLGSLFGGYASDRITTQQLTEDAKEIINILNTLNGDLGIIEPENNPDLGTIIGNNTFIQLIVQTIVNDSQIAGNTELYKSCIAEAIETFNQNIEAYMNGNLTKREVVQFTQDAINKVLNESNGG